MNAKDVPVHFKTVGVAATSVPPKSAQRILISIVMGSNTIALVEVRDKTALNAMIEPAIGVIGGMCIAHVVEFPRTIGVLIKMPHLVAVAETFPVWHADSSLEPVDQVTIQAVVLVNWLTGAGFLKMISAKTLALPAAAAGTFPQ
jgi:hypothetical protein